MTKISVQFFCFLYELISKIDEKFCHTIRFEWICSQLQLNEFCQRHFRPFFVKMRENACTCQFSFHKICINICFKLFIGIIRSEYKPYFPDRHTHTQTETQKCRIVFRRVWKFLRNRGGTSWHQAVGVYLNCRI